MVSLVIRENQEGGTLDRFLRSVYGNSSILDIWRFIEKKEIRVNGQRARQNYRLRALDTITFSDFVEKILNNPLKSSNARNGAGFGRHPGPSAGDGAIAASATLGPIRDHIIYEDADLMAIDKPYGLPVQGGTALAVSVDSILKNFSNAGEQPKLVHRLDRYTTGVLVVAKNTATARRLAKIFRKREDLRKQYLLIVKGRVRRDSGLIDYPLTKRYENSAEKVYVDRLGGREAITKYRTLAYSEDYNLSLLEAEPVTGRTHQIRVHLREIGNPLLGDFKYAGDDGQSLSNKLQLHSRRITLNLSGRDLMFEASVPRHMERVLDIAFPHWRELIL
ncbi:MAG: RluA family pseudouridine synthase [Rickettsiales bacterium]|jgi:23S rRNA pseudouridine955/2504/2580 synthase|nr:RluA family pseudouridine synthase [Rickettsiales bacterium]